MLGAKIFYFGDYGYEKTLEGRTTRLEGELEESGNTFQASFGLKNSKLLSEF